MASLFLYGTLRHVPLFEVVMGRDSGTLNIAQARLEGFAVSAVAEGPFPMIETREGAEAEGLVVHGLSGDDMARLDFYEGSFAYDLVDVTLRDGTAARVYVPQQGRWTPAGPWSLAAWEAEWGEMSVIAAREVMGYMGQRSRDRVAGMFPVIRARAASTVRARASRHGKDVLKGRVEIEERTRSYSEFFALDDLTLRHETFDGGMAGPMDRAVLIAADAALVLPYDPVRDRVLLVEQVRLGPVGRGDRTVWQLEPIAGRVDPGETPQEAVRREAREEAEIELGRLDPIAEVYPSPGTSTEFYYIFLGLADLPDQASGTGGLETEHEDIRSRVMPFAELMDRIDRFDIANAPLALAAYYLLRHRDRLRSEGADATSGEDQPT